MNFEDFIKSKKEDLHTEVPDFKVWNNIQRQLKPQKIHYKVWLAAATVVLMIGAGIFVLLQSKSITTDTVVVNTNTNGDTIQDISTHTLPAVPQKNEQPQAAPINQLNKALAKKASSNSIAAQPQAANTNPAKQSHTDFYDSTINALKQRIEATPVRYVAADYFKIYTDEYKRLDNEEATIKKLLTKHTTPESLLTQLIEINQQKLMILGNLLKQIENVNAKKGDTITNNLTNIII